VACIPQRAPSPPHHAAGGGVTIAPKRGHVYRMQGYASGPLHCLAIATSPVHPGDESFLAVRVSVTGQQLHFPYWVRLRSGDPCGGYVVVHDLDRVDLDELTEDLGPLSFESMFEVEKALKGMLGL
jgi:mRNA-degrading endonuclease toxin of MazEF toxin-antitoxin module